MLIDILLNMLYKTRVSKNKLEIAQHTLMPLHFKPLAASMDVPLYCWRTSDMEVMLYHSDYLQDIFIKTDQVVSTEDEKEVLQRFSHPKTLL